MYRGPYHREGNFRQLNISYLKFSLGFNFRIVRYMHIHYNIVQKFCLDLIFERMSICENKIHTKKTSPMVYGLVVVITVQ